jgi:phosphopantetheinyl transferase
MRALVLPDSWRGRALVITDVENVEAWLTAAEMKEADGFRLAKRKLEWKLSRVAAKKLARDLGLSAGPIEMRRIGTACLSLSHSAPYAAAAIDTKPVGIDIERIRAMNESAAHLFLTDHEIEAMQRLTLPHRLIHFWAAKEAEWKRHGGAIPTLKRVSIRLEDAAPDGLRFDRVETRLIDDLVAALTRPTS